MSFLTNNDQHNRYCEEFHSCLTHIQDLLLTLTSDQQQYPKIDKESIGRVLILMVNHLGELRLHQNEYSSSAVEGLLLDFKESTQDYIRFLARVTNGAY